MLKILNRWTLAVGLAVALAATPVTAADFEITVPVQITKMPETSFAYVVCVVYQGNPNDPDRTVELEIGRGFAQVPQAQGAFDGENPAVDYTGTVLVMVDADTGRLPALADTFGCSLHLGWSIREDFYPDPVLSFEACIEEAGIDDPSTYPLMCGGRGKGVVGWIRGAF